MPDFGVYFSVFECFALLSLLSFYAFIFCVYIEFAVQPQPSKVVFSLLLHQYQFKKRYTGVFSRSQCSYIFQLSCNYRFHRTEIQDYGNRLQHFKATNTGVPYTQKTLIIHHHSSSHCLTFCSILTTSDKSRKLYRFFSFSKCNS